MLSSLPLPELLRTAGHVVIGIDLARVWCGREMCSEFLRSLFKRPRWVWHATPVQNPSSAREKPDSRPVVPSLVYSSLSSDNYWPHGDKSRRSNRFLCLFGRNGMSQVAVLSEPKSGLLADRFRFSGDVRV